VLEEALLGFLAVLAGGFLAFLTSNTFTTPLGRLMQGVHALEQGDFNYQLDLQGGGEVGSASGMISHPVFTTRPSPDKRGGLNGSMQVLH
jgi:HAMP domain-containing protein